MKHQKTSHVGPTANPSDEMVYLHFSDGREQVVPMGGVEGLRSLTGRGQAATVAVFHESRSFGEVRRLARRIESRLAVDIASPELFSRIGEVEGEADWREQPAIRLEKALAGIRAFSMSPFQNLELSTDDVLVMPGDWLEQWLEPDSVENPGSLAEWLGGNGQNESSARESAMQRLLGERQKIIENVAMLDAAEIALLRGSQANEHRALAKRWRDTGELLGVRVGREFLYPEFQFDPQSGRVRPQMAKILARLRAGEADADGWRAMHWFYARAGTLSGERPFEVFPQEPERVLAAARMEFGGNSDADQVSSSAAG